MLIKIKQTSDANASEIVNKQFYMNRRKFLSFASAFGGTALFSSNLLSANRQTLKLGQYTKTHWGKNLKSTSLEAITSYNNFYEFGTDKSDPKKNAYTLKPKPWTLEVSGNAERTGIFNLEDIIKPNLLEERIYRMRCVEAWSMVVPWVGIPLGSVIKQFRPTSKAKYVAFQSLFDTVQMPKQKLPILQWPYREGLRIDEATHPLTILAVGIFGEELPNQNGAPLRLVVPWKYGFKGLKSIVKIDFVETQPPCTWNLEAPNEYGFYSNVNPEVNHPRWSQEFERPIKGASGLSALFTKKIKTLPFNGYGEEVASLYTGMNLREFF